MIKIYVMESCPDCTEAKQLFKDNPAFEKVREHCNIGIPCFVKENGDVIISLKCYDEALVTGKAFPEYVTGAACNLDGARC